MKQEFGAADLCMYNLHASQPSLLPHFESVIRRLRSLDPLQTHSAGLAISLSNQCRYYADIHEASLYATGNGRVAQAVRRGAWTDAGIPETSLAIQYLNRVCNVFVRRPALPFSNTLLRTLYLRLLRPLHDPAPSGPATPDAIIDLCREADVLGNTMLPQSVRIRVQTHIHAWSGDDLGPNRSWVENYLADFSPPHRAMARLALLTALASHQVDPIVIESVALTRRQLLAIVAWASAQVVLHMSCGALTECVH